MPRCRRQETEQRRAEPRLAEGGHDVRLEVEPPLGQRSAQVPRPPPRASEDDRDVAGFRSARDERSDRVGDQFDLCLLAGRGRENDSSFWLKGPERRAEESLFELLELPRPPVSPPRRGSELGGL